MMRRTWLYSCTVVLAFAVAPPCDFTKSGDAFCDDFCNHRCGFYNASAGETGSIQTLTFWRLTPRNVTGIRNKNTGDARGDIGYDLSKKNNTRACARDPHSHDCVTEGVNYYGMFTIEFDGQFGPYLECNPTGVGGTPREPLWKDTRDFYCAQNCLFPTVDGCQPMPPPANDTDGTGFGPTCFCDTSQRERFTVGRVAPSFLGNDTGEAPASWGPQCSAGYSPADPGTCPTGVVSAEVRGWSFESALALACDACSRDPNCTGWATQDNRTVQLFHGNITVLNTSCIGATAYDYAKGVNWFGVGKLGGFWYSTPVAGECPAGTAIGTNGCTWRPVLSVYKNASCVDGRVDESVEAYGKACFEACPQPLDRTSDCYLYCYRDILMGNAGTNTSRIPSELVIDPWIRAFKESDPSKGGCRDVIPDPCEGSQCDPLIGAKLMTEAAVIAAAQQKIMTAVVV